MANTKELKQRITSVTKTQKITQAMKMVAAAKFKRAQDKLNHTKAYGDEIATILSDLISRIEPDNLPPILCPNTSAEKEAIILITGDRGLCGGFNAYIIKKAEQYIEKNNANNVDLFLFGSKGNLYFKKKPVQISATHEHFMDTVTESKTHALISSIVDQYVDGTYRSVRLFYNEFISALSNNQIEKELLPLPDFEEQIKKKPSKSDYFYEPNKTTVLTGFLSQYLTSQVYRAFMESHTAEEGARMAAMDSASENASDVIYDLTLLFNRTRQAGITTEISEIVAGSISLN